MSSPTVGVCGFGRCGSTMAMAMLRAGGLTAVDGSDPVSGELPGLEPVFDMGPDQLAGRAVKLLDSVIPYGIPPGATEWRFVWLDRDPVQQATSQVKLARAMGVDLADDAVEVLAASYAKDRPVALGRLRRRGPVVVLRYENVLANPRRAAKQLRQVFPALDVLAAAAVVHDRDGRCRPDLAFEAHGQEVPSDG